VEEETCLPSNEPVLVSGGALPLFLDGRGSNKFTARGIGGADCALVKSGEFAKKLGMAEGGADRFALIFSPVVSDDV
jgi:hypothetical protein